MITFRRFSWYAICAVGYMADQKLDRPVGAAQIARQLRLPGPYLARALKLLARAGVVDARRGVRGGIRLAKPADRISLLEIVEALDGPVRAEGPQVTAQDAVDQRLQTLCEDVAGDVRQMLARLKVTDLVS